jgi:DNA helicase II / ATP-dependent DNA helicase PcrA
LPDTLFEVNKADATEENRRLFYVAMTRAKQQLIISYAERDAKDKEQEKSCFVAELETHASLNNSFVTVPDETLMEMQAAVMQKEKTAVAQHKLFDNEFVDELLDKYVMSVTHLNNYLKCPTTFYFNNLIRVPAPLSPNMTFGSAVHHALEMLFKQMNLHPEKQFADAAQLVNDFKWYMRRHEDSFTPIEFKRRIEYGEQILAKYYQTYIGQWNKITSIERSYRNVVVQNVPVTGKLDKLEFDGNMVNVVDYKTGQFENAKHKFSGPDILKYKDKKHTDDERLHEYQYGGDYWRQAVFYKILMDNDKSKNWNMVSAEFDFVEPDKKTGEYIKQKVSFSQDDIKIVTTQLVTAYLAIKNKQFENGCQKPECEWCNFVNEYYGK